MLGKARKRFRTQKASHVKITLFPRDLNLYLKNYKERRARLILNK